MVDASYELLPLFREGEDPAVALEQTDHVGIVSRNQGLRKVPDQRSQRREFGWSRVAGDPVGQSLLRGRQLVQERLVPEQGNERRLVPVEAFVGGVEERCAAQDGTAEGTPALGPGVCRLGRIEMIAGLETAVAEYSKDRSAVIVRAALGHDVDGPPGRSAQLRGERIPVDLELLHRVLADGGPDAPGGVVVVQPVDGEGVAAPTATADAESGRGCRGDAEVTIVGHVVRVHDSRREKGQVQVVAAVDGEVLDAGRVDMVGLLGLVAGDDDPPCLRRDDDFFGGHDDLRGEGLGFSDQDLQILHHVGSEARQFEAKRVEARIDSAHDIFAEVRGEGLPDHAPALISGGDGDAGKDGPGLVVDVTPDGAGVGLGGEQNGAGQQQRGRGSRLTQRATGARKTRTDKALIRHDVTLPIESTRLSRVAGKHWPEGCGLQSYGEPGRTPGWIGPRLAP